MKFSIIIPVYNSEQYLKKCIDSILNQTYSDWEIVAINDGSTDKSFDILSYYAKQDQRVRVYTQSNMGPGVTRNKAILEANGDYIVFIDSDDYVEPDYLSLVDFEIYKNASEVIYIDLIQEDIHGKLIKEERISKYMKLTKKELLCYQMTGKIPWGGVRKVVKKSLIQKWNICYTTDTVGEEAIFSFELLYHCKKYSFVNMCVYHYVNHPQSQSKKGNVELGDFVINGWTIIARKMKQHLLEKELYCEFEESVNAFGFTALIGWLINNKKKPYRKLAKQFKKMVNEFEMQYGWNIGKKYLRTEMKLLVPFVRIRFLFPVVIAAKLR